MNSYLNKCRDLATYFLEDSDVTNADRLTLEKHVEALANQFEQAAAAYMDDAHREAANEAEKRDQYLYEKAAGYDV